MRVDTVSTTAEDNPLLRGIRDGLTGAERALLCVAFVSDAGVNLLHDQLSALGESARVMVTTHFGTSSATALNTLSDMGAQVRVLNPRMATFHPKLYLADRGRNQSTALIGSANLTRGLVVNHEIAALMRGKSTEPAIARAWEWAEEVWRDNRASIWHKKSDARTPRFEDRELHALLRREVERDPVFLTLSNGKINRVVTMGESELYVETERTKAQGRPPQPIPAWMLELAWGHLRQRGTLSNRLLIGNTSDGGLNVKRSSAVCAILARLPQVEIASRRPIELRWIG